MSDQKNGDLSTLMALLVRCYGHDFKDVGEIFGYICECVPCFLLFFCTMTQVHNSIELLLDVRMT